MAGGKIIGGPFSDGVINQLNIRSKILAKNARTPEEIVLLNSKTGWAKLSSGVNVNGSNNLAQEYVLIGGQKGLTGTNTYSNYFGEAGKGFRPMPGITSVQIRSINQFGTLKEATITFNCWDRGQLTDLEKLYMRPGFTALLEWGHSMYTKDGKTPYDKHVETVSSFFNSGQSKEAIYKEIEKLKVQSAYNYDGILGFVKNFSWSFRPDGGYDCTTTVISIGEIMESLTIDVDTPSVTERNATEAEGSIIPVTMVQDIIVNIKGSDSITTVWSDIVAKFTSFVTKHKKVGGRDGLDVVRTQLNSIKSGETIDSTAGMYFTYISLRSFCELVNTVIIVDNNDRNVIKLNTDIRPLGETSSSVPACRFRSYKFHTSSDPNVCVLLTDTTKNWSYNEDLLASLQSQKEGSTNEILNIYVNLNFLQKQVAAVFAQPKESRTLLNLFQPILAELNTVLGNINDFSLHYEESEFTYYIVDRKIETGKGELDNSVLNITGLKSAVSKFDFTTKLSPALTTMIAISAQAGGADVGVEADALLRWNEGLSDRIIKKKTVKTSEAASNAAEDKQATDKQQQERRTAINTALGTFYNQRQYDREAIEIARMQNIQFASEYVQNHQATDNNAGPAGIIPFEVGIEMDGISGIKIGQAFTINEGIMPAKYDGVVGFIVTGVDHTISANRWVTNLKAQTIILQGGGKTADKDYPNNENPDQKKKGVGSKKSKGTYYPEFELTDPPPKATKMTYAYAAKYLSEKYDADLAKAVFTIIYAEASKSADGLSFNSAGGHNYSGVQTDSGRWGSPGIIGRFIRKDAVRLREFAMFTSDATFLDFMANRVSKKGISGKDKSTWSQKYLNTWVFLNLEKQDITLYNKLKPEKEKIYKGAIKRYNKYVV